LGLFNEYCGAFAQHTKPERVGFELSRRINLAVSQADGAMRFLRRYRGGFAEDGRVFIL
jgi:hypothetical protein